MQPEFDVIQVSYKGARKKLPGNYNWIGIDNLQGNNRPVANFDEDGIYYAPGENLGWVKAANIGLAMSTAPHVVLMNDDCTVEDSDWLERLRDAFSVEWTSPLAAVGPQSNFTAPQNNSEWFPREKTVLMPDKWNLSFFCVMLSREALTKVGYLDERFSPGLAEDDDWQIRARKAGFSIAVCGDVFVHHEGQQSWESREERDRIQRRNTLLLREKWGGDCNI